MANDCLITKLKSAVNNDALEYLGMVAEDLLPGMGTTKVVFNAASTVKILHGTVGGRTEVSYAANENEFIVSKGAISVESGYEKATILIPKYSLTSIIIKGSEISDQSVIYVPHVDLNDFKYSQLTALDFSNVKIVPNLNVLNNLTKLSISNGRTKFTEEFDVSNLGVNGRMTSIYLRGVGVSSNHNLKGSLDKSGCSPLNTLGFPSTKAVSFNVENFVAYNRGAGRTTGSITLDSPKSCDATFNGNPIQNSGNLPLSWTASTITLNGTEINNSDVLVP